MVGSGGDGTTNGRFRARSTAQAGWRRFSPLLSHNEITLDRFGREGRTGPSPGSRPLMGRWAIANRRADLEVRALLA